MEKIIIIKEKKKKILKNARRKAKRAINTNKKFNWQRPQGLQWEQQNLHCKSRGSFRSCWEHPIFKYKRESI